MTKNRKVRKQAPQQSLENPEYSGMNQLVEGEENLDSYNRFLVKSFGKFLTVNNEQKPQVLDFGAGVGTLALLWKEMLEISPFCVEIDDAQFTTLQHRGFEATKDFKTVSQKFDLIYTSNVLEHILDDQLTIKELSTALKKSGKLVIYVPAFMILFSGMDEAVGHYRRYARQELLSKVKAAGLHVDKCVYVDSLGFPASLAIRILGYKGAANIGGSLSLRIYDKLIFPISRLLDRLGFQYLIGKNLFLVASLDK